MLFWGLMCFIVDVSLSAMITCLLDLSQLLAKRDQPSTKLAESLGKEYFLQVTAVLEYCIQLELRSEFWYAPS